MSVILTLADLTNFGQIAREDHLLMVLRCQAQPHLVYFCADSLESVNRSLADIRYAREFNVNVNMENLEITEECMREVRFSATDGHSLQPLDAHALGVMYDMLQYIPWQRVAPRQGLYFAEIGPRVTDVRYWPLHLITNPPQTVCYTLRRVIYGFRASLRQPVRSLSDSVVETCTSAVEALQLLTWLSKNTL